ncbi:MAG TPA: chemotaxis protein CheB [Chitinophagaceae bacterium]|nr:chemotaxis protein CheB [Chitinophagaceae bacterium]
MESLPKFIIVIGASAGGADALRELLLQLGKGEQLAVFIVLHLSGKGISEFLMLHLQKYTSLQCKVAEDKEIIQQGRLYVAPADQHLLISDGIVKLGRGPAENRWRPSINVLFRSAAAAYTDRVIGIILTGLLDDGTAGMSAIMRSGGTSIVQDPNEASFPDMPLSVLDNMNVDYCVPLAEMGTVVAEILKNKEVGKAVSPADVISEAEIAEKLFTAIPDMEVIGEQTVYACPDCGGGLWKIHSDDNTKRYRCHVGHVFSEKNLWEKQGESLESTLWVALRMMEERHNLLARISKDERRKGLHTLASAKEIRLAELQVHIDKLKELLFSIQNK